ncbi:MAG: hypothetical protein AAF555_05620 [Verrucomicrobiota bacterium]
MKSLDFTQYRETSGWRPTLELIASRALTPWAALGNLLARLDTRHLPVIPPAQTAPDMTGWKAPDEPKAPRRSGLGRGLDLTKGRSRRLRLVR